MQLYILNRHAPTDDISTIHTKVQTSLSFLTRMGFLQRTGNDNDESDDDDSANIVMTSPKKKSPTKSKKADDAKATPPPKKKATKIAVKVKAKNVSVKKADKLKAKAKKNVDKKVVDKSESENVEKKRIVTFRPKRLSPALAAICGKRILSRQVKIDRVSKEAQYSRTPKSGLVVVRISVQNYHPDAEISTHFYAIKSFKNSLKSGFQWNRSTDFR